METMESFDVANLAWRLDETKAVDADTKHIKHTGKNNGFIMILLCHLSFLMPRSSLQVCLSG
jgi:hypothetical protein